MTYGHAATIVTKELRATWYATEEQSTKARLCRQFLAHYRALADAVNETDAALLVALAKREVGEDERA